MNKLILMTTSLFLLSSCSNSSGGSGGKNLSPLDQNAKTSMARVLAKVGNISHLGLDQSPSHAKESGSISSPKPENSNSAENQISLLVAALDNSFTDINSSLPSNSTIPSKPSLPSNPSNPELDRNSQSLSKMKKIVDDPNQCQTNIEAPKGNDSQASKISTASETIKSSLSFFKVTISGPNCPIEMTLSIQGQTQNETGITDANFSLSYKTIDPNFLKESDLDQISMNGKIYLKMDASKENENKPLNIEFNVNISGQGRSMTEGDFNISDINSGKLSMPAQSTTLDFQMTDELNLNIHNIEGVLRTVIRQNDKEQIEQYFLNSQQITKEEAEEFLKQVDFLRPANPSTKEEPRNGSQIGKPITKPESPYLNPFACNAAIYSTDVISTELLTEKVNQNQIINEYPEKIYTTCSQMDSPYFSDILKQGKLSLNFFYFKDHVVLSAKLESARAVSYSKQTLLSNDTGNSVKAIGTEYSIWMHCEPVQTCL